MLKLYKYLYFRFYRIFEFFQENDDINDWKAFLGFSFFLSLNILVIFELSGFTRILNPSSNLGKLLIPGVIVIVGILNYFLLFRNNKVDEISKLFSEMKNKYRKFGSVGVILYMILSIILFLVFWIGN